MLYQPFQPGSGLVEKVDQPNQLKIITVFSPNRTRKDPIKPTNQPETVDPNRTRH